MIDYERQPDFYETDFLEQITDLDSLKDTELRDINFPTKRNVLRNFVEKNRLPRFRNIEEDDKGVLVARFGSSDDVFKVYATGYNPPLFKIDSESESISYQSSVLYTGQGKAGWINTERNPLIAKITFFGSAKITKKRRFNMLSLFLEKNNFKNKKDVDYSRVIKRLDYNPEIYFLTEKMHKTELGDAPLTSLYID